MTECSKQFAGVPERLGKKFGCRPNICFLFIGAEPNTDWLSGSGFALDAKGFALTGADKRRPLETSREGVFAIGDARSGSVKRVAAAVGEGAQVVATLHAYLAAAEWVPTIATSH
jgi:thioredoxin reductase (NADPH)